MPRQSKLKPKLPPGLEIGKPAKYHGLKYDLIDVKDGRAFLGFNGNIDVDAALDQVKPWECAPATPPQDKQQPSPTANLERLLSGEPMEQKPQKKDVVVIHGMNWFVDKIQTKNKRTSVFLFSPLGEVIRIPGSTCKPRGANRWIFQGVKANMATIKAAPQINEAKPEKIKTAAPVAQPIVPPQVLTMRETGPASPIKTATIEIAGLPQIRITFDFSGTVGGRF